MSVSDDQVILWPANGQTESARARGMLQCVRSFSSPECCVAAAGTFVGGGACRAGKSVEVGPFHHVLRESFP